jgi:hypothetical protein
MSTDEEVELIEGYPDPGRAHRERHEALLLDPVYREEYTRVRAELNVKPVLDHDAIKARLLAYHKYYGCLECGDRLGICWALRCNRHH